MPSSVLYAWALPYATETRSAGDHQELWFRARAQEISPPKSAEGVAPITTRAAAPVLKALFVFAGGAAATVRVAEVDSEFAVRVGPPAFDGAVVEERTRMVVSCRHRARLATDAEVDGREVVPHFAGRIPTIVSVA